MSNIEAIATLYQQVDNFFEGLREQAKGDEDRCRIEYQQKLNDQACFVLAWGQLEANIDKACRKAIRSGRSHREWEHRRAWSLYNLKKLRLSFRDRLTLVLDKSRGEWKRTMDYYEVRNQIAHGNLRSEGIDVSTVIEDFNHILSEIEQPQTA